jgi:hypothetical protein
VTDEAEQILGVAGQTVELPHHDDVDGPRVDEVEHPAQTGPRGATRLVRGLPLVDDDVHQVEALEVAQGADALLLRLGGRLVGTVDGDADVSDSWHGPDASAPFT